jgi:hypothetical protein
MSDHCRAVLVAGSVRRGEALPSKIHRAGVDVIVSPRTQRLYRPGFGAPHQLKLFLNWRIRCKLCTVVTISCDLDNKVRKAEGRALK